MAWQGIPYPPFTVDAGLAVTKIPELVVNTGFGWDTVAGSVVAAFIGAALPTGVAFYTLWRNDRNAAQERANQLADLTKTRETQVELAEMAFNSQVLSSNRQQWINTLRGYISTFISILGNEISLKYLYSIQQKSENKEKGNHIETLQLSLENKKTINELTAHIELMLNPRELTSKALLQCLREIKKLVYDEDPHMFYQKDSEVNKMYVKKKKSLIRVSQRCLKSEWKRVKSGK